VEHLEIYGACALSGLIAVPINPLFGDGELKAVVEDAEPAWAVVEDDWVERIRGIASGVHLVTLSEFKEAVSTAITDPVPVKVSATGDWAILFTSGTTSGVPKGVVRSQEASVLGFITHTGPMAFDHQGVSLTAFPLHSVSSFFFAFLFHYVGGSVAVHDLMTYPTGADVWGSISKFNPTYLTLAPQHFRAILGAASDFPGQGASLRTILLSGASSDVSLRQQVMQCFPRSAVFEIYGSTEAGLITMLLPEDQDKKPGSVGREPPGNPAVVLAPVEGFEGDSGEVLCKTPMMFSRYWRKEDLTAASFTADGYFKHSDVAARDADGFFFLLGRKDDCIVMGTGRNVMPDEVEKALLQHGDVELPVVVAVPGQDGSPAVAAVIVAKQGAAVSEEMLAEHCSKFIAAYKVPSRWAWAQGADIPRTANGKVIRKQVVARFFQ